MTIASLLTSVIINIIPINGTIPNLSGHCNETYAWWYIEQSWTIYVCYNSNEAQLQFVKYHELGHHFWFKFMTQEQRDEYTKLYNKESFKSYNVEEDFADIFSAYVLNIKHNKSVNKRIYLIRKYIKNQ